MPETPFSVRWPDGTIEACYSPSSVIKRHFELGRAYTPDEFLKAARQALRAASERVQERYGGYGCSRAMAQLAAIEDKLRDFREANAVVRVEAFEIETRRRA